MNNCLKLVLLVVIFCNWHVAVAQEPDKIYADNIKTVQLYVAGNQLAYPIIRLNSADRLELHFDDLDGNIKNISYTWQLCDADWTASILNSMDFIKGFSQQRINNYRISSLALTKYVHYQAILPDNNCMPTRSGNYLIKVFLNGDVSKLLFTRRVLVVDEKVTIPCQIQQPLNGKYFYSHQKLYFTIEAQRLDLLNVNQQVKVCLLQNNRWDNAITNIKPTFNRSNQLEYNTEEDCLFPGGKEWRWLDLRSFRLQSDRVQKADYGKTATDIFVVPDLDRSTQRFVFYRDYDGQFFNEVYESVNPMWQADYATVHFSYKPAAALPGSGKDVYIFGAISNYGLNENAKMIFNEQTGLYEAALMLKQGYYDYSYVTVDAKDPKHTASFDMTEGNYWDTENMYMILVYYRPIGGRADELVGFTKINSLAGR